MSADVHKAYNADKSSSFTEDAPRPPVPGEENDNDNNSGHSTRSYGSLKSHSSGRSSGKRMSDVCHSPCGTPRQSSLGKKYCDDAPLGFEPEGSVSNSPPFTENSSPPYLKWAENINYLLEDSDGVRLFTQFLVQEEDSSSNLDFWFACQGFKKSVKPSDTQKIHQLIKVIYRSYIRGDGSLASVSISGEVKKSIVERISKKLNLDQSIFDEAQREVEHHLKNTAYPSFLKSDLYVQYVQSGGDDGSGKTSTTTSSSGSNSTRPMSAVLPTVHEEAELQSDECKSSTGSTGSMPAPLTSETLMATRFSRAEISKHNKRKKAHDNRSAMSRSYPSGGSSSAAASAGRVPNPYHVSYAPVSAQDSELQSLSSDALTDETMSLTDSSVDGVPLSYSHKKWKAQQRRAMRTGAQQNKDTQLTHDIIPRTERAPKDRNIAEVDPPAFAAMLTEKLEKVLKELENMEKIKKLMIEGEDLDESKLHSTEVSLSSLMAAAMEQRGVEDNAQSILEDHVSRIWDNSAGQTPSRSPGRHTPTSKSPERAYRKLLSPGYMASPAAVNYSKKRKDKDYSSLVSYDSGVSEQASQHQFADESCTPHCKHIHHYHHHHHVKASAGGSAHDASIGQYGYYENDGYRDGGSSRPASQSSVRRGQKKMSDSSSNVYDSGVSVAYDRSPPSSGTHSVHPANEKVLNWMLENDKLKDYNSHPESERSSSHKRSHKASVSSPSTHRQISKKQSSSHSSREGSSVQSWVGPDVAPPHHKKPSQPIVQDPNMPLMAAPNPITQLEEAKRRLEKEVNSKMPKSRSFTGTVTKESNNNVSMSKQRAMMPPPAAPHTPCRRDAADVSTTSSYASTTQHDTSQSSQNSRESSQHKTLASSAPGTPGPAAAPSSGEKTIVGYYMCGDPIPYRTTLDGKHITLRQFKQTITKKGNYRYFCKKACDEFDTGVVHEEITDDNQILPLWENKIVVKVEKVD